MLIEVRKGSVLAFKILRSFDVSLAHMSEETVLAIAY